MVEPFPCNRCRSRFWTERGLNIHKRMVHKKKTAKEEKRRLQNVKASRKYRKTDKGKRRAAEYEKTAKRKAGRKKYRQSKRGLNTALRNEETRRQKRRKKVLQNQAAREKEGEEIKKKVEELLKRKKM